MYVLNMFEPTWADTELSRGTQYCDINDGKN
jgi:hypothetical protein